MSSLNLPQIRLPSGVLKPGMFWKKRSVTISDVDPQYRVTYLGNVLTAWAKGDGCVDKPLSTLWRNHTSSDKPNILMKLTITAQGLKAVTKEHGLTEYWAHRITFCVSDPNYPKVFCWIYRHEGRKMKQELRCHAVLCSSENKARLMAKKLQERLHQALIDFKKEKISRQNARLSLANTIYDNPSMPYRKILLHTGTSNYRPPHEKGKSAPKLKAIEEVIVEEDDEAMPALGAIAEEDEEEAAAEEVDALRRIILPLTRSSSSPCHGTSPSTAMTSVVSSVAGCDIGRLVDVIEDPPEEGDLPSFEPLSLEDKQLQMAKVPQEVNQRLMASFDDEDDTSDEDDDQDEIRNYLPEETTLVHQPIETILGPSSIDILKLEEVDSAATGSPDSRVFSTRSNSSRSRKSLVVSPRSSFRMMTSAVNGVCVPDNGHVKAGKSDSTPSTSSSSNVAKIEEVDSFGDEEEEEELVGLEVHNQALRLSEQDAISDESGYSEESSSPSTVSKEQSNIVNNDNGKIVINASTGKLRLGERHSGAKTFVNLNQDLATETDCDNLPSLDPALATHAADKSPGSSSAAANTSISSQGSIHCDLTVHSALISEITPQEQLKYLDRSSRASSVDRQGAAANDNLPLGASATSDVTNRNELLANRVPDFCIEI